MHRQRGGSPFPIDAMNDDDGRHRAVMGVAERDLLWWQRLLSAPLCCVTGKVTSASSPPAADTPLS
jgi:hypothetical protein